MQANTHTHGARASVMTRFIRAALALFALTLAGLAGAADAGNGIVSCIVTNAKTGNGLEGAKVEIAQLKLSALVDRTGRYVIEGVPAGRHELTVTYVGMDPGTATIQVSAGVAARQKIGRAHV